MALTATGERICNRTQRQLGRSVLREALSSDDRRLNAINLIDKGEQRGRRRTRVGVVGRPPVALGSHTSSIVHLRSFSSRSWLAAVAGFALVAAVTAPFLFLSARVQRLELAAAISLAAALAAGVVAKRFRRAENERLAERLQLDWSEQPFRALVEGVPLVT